MLSLTESGFETPRGGMRVGLIDVRWTKVYRKIYMKSLPLRNTTQRLRTYSHSQYSVSCTKKTLKQLRSPRLEARLRCDVVYTLCEATTNRVLDPGDQRRVTRIDCFF